MDTDAADARSLKLATPALDSAKLDALVRYQRAWLERLEAHGQGREPLPAPEAVAIDAGLPPGEVGPLEALFRDFCGRRWTYRELVRKRAELEARPHLVSQGGRPSRAEEIANKLDERIVAEEEALARFTRRYGEQTRRLLLEREDELLALHRARQKLDLGA